MATLVEISKVLEEPYWRAREEKKAGREVIGVSPMYFPEELIHASGALPIVLQETNRPIDIARAYIFPNYCGVVVNNVDEAISGNLDFLDAIIISDMCLFIRTGFSIMDWWMPVPFIYMQWPYSYDMELWRSFVMPRLNRCKHALEEVTGNRITDERIQASIELYNRNRRLLQQIDELRRRKPGLLRASEMSGLVMSSMVMPKEEHNALLEQFIPKLERSSPASSGKAKIFLSGHICSRVRSDILDLIEDSGGLVVGDDLYVGARYFATEIPIDLPPMEALAKGFFNISIPCPTRAEEQEDPRRDWANYVVSNARESGAQGIICLFPKWCSYINFSLPSLRDKLAEAGIPYIILDTEHEMASLGTVKTRIAAFIEMLESKGG